MAIFSVRRMLLQDLSRCLDGLITDGRVARKRSITVWCADDSALEASLRAAIVGMREACIALAVSIRLCRVLRRPVGVSVDLRRESGSLRCLRTFLDCGILYHDIGIPIAGAATCLLIIYSSWSCIVVVGVLAVTMCICRVCRCMVMSQVFVIIFQVFVVVFQVFVVVFYVFAFYVFVFIFGLLRTLHAPPTKARRSIFTEIHFVLPSTVAVPKLDLAAHVSTQDHLFMGWEDRMRLCSPRGQGSRTPSPR